MNLFLDTSALIKKYIVEKGSEKVEELVNEAEIVYIAVVAEIEAFSTIKRLLVEKAISEDDCRILKEEFALDFQYLTKSNLNKNIVRKAKSLIEKYQLKSLDSIQLGTAIYLKNNLDYFVVCDHKLINAGEKEGLAIIDPTS